MTLISRIARNWKLEQCNTIRTKDRNNNSKTSSPQESATTVNESNVDNPDYFQTMKQIQANPPACKVILILLPTVEMKAPKDSLPKRPY